MRIRVHVRDEVIVVDCGEGNQRIKWLAMVSLQRFGGTAGERQSHKHVATGVMTAEGVSIASNNIISRALVDGQDVFVRVQEDEKIELGADGAHMALGTSPFLISQGASAVRCTLSGRGIGHAVLNEATHLYVIARDTYGNLTRNGGDQFTLRTEGPGVVESSIRDLGDGSYHVTFACTAVGRYAFFIELEGLNIDGSPFSTIVTRKPEISLLKWFHPALSGSSPHAVAMGTSVSFGRRVLVYGGTAGGDRPSNAMRVLHTDKMRWAEATPIDGPLPPAAYASASAIIGTRLFVYGGETREGTGPSPSPLDQLWVFDVATTEWAQLELGGLPPGPLSFGAAAAIGNTLFLFGGWNGAQVHARMHTLHTSASVASWEPATIAAGSASVSARLGHSMVAIGEKLYVYGGRGADADALDSLLGDVAIFDPALRGGGAGLWTIAKTMGEVPRERWLHSCGLLGEQMVVFGGFDSAGESTSFALLNVSSLRWDSWDSSAARAGGMLQLVDGRALVIGGLEHGLASEDVLQYSLGGFQLELDGERDEAMIPHPPLLLPTAYTVEAWICPAKVGSAMNIVCRSSEAYPKAVWSHQLRINDRGKLQHVTMLASGERVVLESNSSVKPGVWTHVAGAASSDGMMSLTLNGSDDGVPPLPLGGALNSQLDRIFVGARTGDNMGLFRGVIAELRVWNSARSPEAVREEMKRAVKGSEPGLVGSWRLNEGPGGIVFDQTVAANHGLVNGTPVWNAALCPVATGELDAHQRANQRRGRD